MTAPQPHRRIAFLLSQLGSAAAAAFDSAVRELGISPSEAGLLRLVGRAPVVNQRSVSTQLGVGPSRVVAVLDRLESGGLVERRRSAGDRRNHEIALTDRGRELLGRLRAVAERHELAFVAPLTPDQIRQLGDTLATIAAARGLSADVHRETAVASTGPDERATVPSGDNAAAVRRKSTVRHPG
ncbi:MarR family transcriptional regulator [Nakamurella sp. A5-74]|uniref:MarR family transcriptional regulator n=1 Tax=Nakamurella sp. A5-74 TaxID=3158264 RepID=A0AAU8DNC5_9ACTN